MNYYFNFSDQIISDNVRSLERDLKNKNSTSQSNKYFNIKNLDAKVKDYDPYLALNGGKDGLTAFRIIINSIKKNNILDFFIILLHKFNNLVI